MKKKPKRKTKKNQPKQYSTYQLLFKPRGTQYSLFQDIIAPVAVFIIKSVELPVKGCIWAIVTTKETLVKRKQATTEGN